MSSQALEILSQLGAESCTYTPYGKAGRTVLAVVEPLRRTDSLGNQTFLSKTYEAWVVKSATEGVLSVREGYDTLAIKLRPTDSTMSTLRITKVYPERDAGFPGDGVGLWHLEATL